MSQLPSLEQQQNFMRQAIQLAKEGDFTARPNPKVGCVLVKNGQLIAQGAHLIAGQEHAEVAALRQAASLAKGADAYVTLEPCSHTGKTGPCADALIAAGVERVFIAQEDPNPLVAGKGIAKLKAASIEVITGVLAAEAAKLNLGFNQRMRYKKPYLVLKLAASLDGAIAMASGESQWITSQAARADVQKLRAASCALISGVDAVNFDDSRLTVRAENLVNLAGFKQPLRVVVDSKLRINLDAAILRQPGITYIATSAAALSQNLEKKAALELAQAKFLIIPTQNDFLNLAVLLSELSKLEVNQVLLETGPRLAGAFLQQGLVDALEIYLAPVLLGQATKNLVQLEDVTQLNQGIKLELQNTQQVGADLRLSYKVKEKASN